MELLTSSLDSRVQRAFAFVDVCGFSEMIDQRGDDMGMRVLADFRSQVRETCGRYGVRVAKWLGDGAMLVGVDATQLMCAAVTIVQDRDGPGPIVRGGMTVGEVLIFEGDDYIGRTVNLAARLCDHAGSSQLLVAASEALPVPPSLQLVPHAALSVRGFRAPVDVCTVSITAVTGEIARL
jgi:adenylate cyclase